MFGIGAGELFVIFIIAIVVIGPKQLPEVARTIGKLFATAKRTTNQLRDQMHEEVRKFQEMEEVKEFKQSIESEVYSVQETAETYVKKEFEEEERRLAEETRAIDATMTAEAERMLSSGVAPEETASIGDAEPSAIPDGDWADHAPAAASTEQVATASTDSGSVPAEGSSGAPDAGTPAAATHADTAVAAASIGLNTATPHPAGTNGGSDSHKVPGPADSTANTPSTKAVS